MALLGTMKIKQTGLELSSILSRLQSVEDGLNNTASDSAITDLQDKINVLNGDASTDGSVAKSVKTAIDTLIGGAPAALDTLKEIADALNDDANIVSALHTYTDNAINTLKSTILGDSPTYTTLKAVSDEIADIINTTIPTAQTAATDNAVATIRDGVDSSVDTLKKVKSALDGLGAGLSNANALADSNLTRLDGMSGFKKSSINSSRELVDVPYFDSGTGKYIYPQAFTNFGFARVIYNDGSYQDYPITITDSDGNEIDVINYNGEALDISDSKYRLDGFDGNDADSVTTVLCGVTTYKQIAD